MSLVYRGLRTFHYMELPSAGRKLQANFSGVIAFNFLIDVVSNLVFENHETNSDRKGFQFWSILTFHGLLPNLRERAEGIKKHKCVIMQARE